MTITTSVSTSAVLGPDVGPEGPELATTLADLLTASMFTVTNPEDFALELMHGAVLTDVARVVADEYARDLVAVYPPSGPEGPWTLAIYDPTADAIEYHHDLTRAEADASAAVARADGLVVTVETLSTQ